VKTRNVSEASNSNNFYYDGSPTPQAFRSNNFTLQNPSFLEASMVFMVEKMKWWSGGGLTKSV
jgi:hypothetical protein